MNGYAVIKNLFVKGPAETYRIHKKREKDKKKNVLKEKIIHGIVESSFEQVRDDFEKYLELVSNGNVTEKTYQRRLKSIYIKDVLPRIYMMGAEMQIEHKIVFMEHDSADSLAPSLGCMLKYVEGHTDYMITKCMLGRLELSLEQYYENAKEFVREMSTAEVLFACTANDLMGHFKLRPETVYVQLWHGCGVFKKIGLSTIDKKFGKSAAGHKAYPMNTNYTYVTIASPEVSWIFEEAMNIEKDSGIIVPTGVSRTDELFDQDFISNSFRKLYEEVPQARGKKVILYAPTFRGAVSACTSPDQLDVGAFAEKLSDKYILLFKHHQCVKNPPDIPEPYRESFAFDMTDRMDISELMSVSDICISDYSSLVFEYSLFERPMIFFTFDLDEYIDERGLYYEFDEITPGPMFRTNEDMIDYILHIDERFDKQEVIDFKNRFMKCCDGHSTERIWKLVRDRIVKKHVEIQWE